MRLHRLRIQLDDSPGSLGQAATALGTLGVNILDVDVHGVGGDHRADVLIVELTVPLDLPAVEAALRRVGSALVDVRRADPHELVDLSTRCLELAAGLVAEGLRSDEQVGELVRRVVRSDLWWVGPVPGISVTGVAARALDRGAPAQDQEPVKRLAPVADRAWSLAIPFSMLGPQRVLVLVRCGPRFSFTETARAQALLRLASVTAATPERHASPLAEGGTGTITRPAGRTDGRDTR